MRSLGCQHTDVVFNIKHTVADGISNGNANGPFRNDFTSPVYLLCIIFLEVSTIFLFNYEKREIEKRTKMKTCINISFPSKVRFRKKVHSQTSDHVWFFLNLFSKRPREKKKRRRISYFAVFCVGGLTIHNTFSRSAATCAIRELMSDRNRGTG